MENKGHGLKKFLLAGILVVLLLPLVQQHVKMFESKPLKGFAVPKEQAFFTMGQWWDGRYQLRYEEWYNENFGFRNALVRVHNQLAYSLYDEAKAVDVITGKENYLYEYNYIKAYTGIDFIGYPAMQMTVDRLKTLQDSMEKQNITLIVCLAPGKASFYPEYIPDSYGPASDSTNYLVMAKMLSGKGVNTIDYNKWFMDMKPKSEFLLYPRTGIHWSRYGSTMALDSLIRYVEHKRNVDMPGIIWERTILSDSLREPDEDISLAMNLIWPIKPDPMGYPVYHFEDTTGKAKVSMMAISDSYFWSIFDVGLAPKSFSDIDFYYYFKEVHHTDGSPMSMASNETAIEDASGHQVVMLMCTEANAWGLGWGFIDCAYDHFVSHRMIDPKDKLVQAYENSIRMNEKWMQDIRKKAQENGVPLDSMIHMDAVYMAEQEMLKKQ
ncbi:MAG TPA: hypothetical protein VK826_02615 [Bacteroidia bacterium]|nr:hypothetical protein [Bacteroidia bacterium]